MDLRRAVYSPRDVANQKKKIYVGGLSLDTNCEELRQYFSEFGDISDAVIIPHPDTQRSRGFGFVTFYDEDLVDDLLKKEHILNGKTLQLKRAVSKDEVINNPVSLSKTKKVYIARTFGLTEAEIKDYFDDNYSSYGRVETVDLLKFRDSGKPRGFGFIIFSTFEIVDKICVEKIHMIKNQETIVSKAEPKEQRIERFAKADSRFTRYENVRSNRSSTTEYDSRVRVETRYIHSHPSPPPEPPTHSISHDPIGTPMDLEELKRMEEEIAIREEQLRLRELKLKYRAAAMMLSTRTPDSKGSDQFDSFGPTRNRDLRSREREEPYSARSRERYAPSQRHY